MIVVKQIKPARLKEDDMRLALLNGMRKVGTQIKQEYEKTFETWSNKPKAEYTISLTGGGPTVVAGVGGNDKAAKHWRYLNEGTSVRHAVMSSDWKSKTVPNIIGSFGGQGEVVFISRKINLPGIEARNWDKLIAKEMQPRFKRAMEQTMRDVAKASGHGMR
jgi:hypothetical protein